MSSQASKRIILVIGATGAQGIPVIDALLAPQADGSPSPYAIRALTRDATSRRAIALQEKGVELVQGSFLDFPAVLKAFEGVYGAWINTDGFTVPADQEVYAGIRIHELARQAGVRHYIWSGLDYVFKVGNWNIDYRVDHVDAKGRVNEYLRSQPSAQDGNDLTWSIVTTGPYMDMLKMHMFGPLNIREDGTYVFASPIQDGRAPMIALSDIGFFARYSFDNRALVSAKELKIATEEVGWDDLVATFQRVTGKKAVYVRQSLDEWFANFSHPDRKVAKEATGDTFTWRQNFSGWWRSYRDCILERDMKWIRSVNPNGPTLESWMRTNKYTGDENLAEVKKRGEALLKIVEDNDQAGSLNYAVTKRL